MYFTPRPRVRLVDTRARARESAIGTHIDHIHMATCRQYTPADEAFDKLMAMCSLRQWVFQSPNTVLLFVPFVVLLVAAVIAVTLLDVARTFGETAQPFYLHPYLARTIGGHTCGVRAGDCSNGCSNGCWVPPPSRKAAPSRRSAVAQGRTCQGRTCSKCLGWWHPRAVYLDHAAVSRRRTQQRQRLLPQADRHRYCGGVAQRQAPTQTLA